jgi:DNA-binding helix-hairpin-helix protein with protein kinase domain
VTEVYLERGAKRRAVRLGKLLGEGAAGKVHAIEGMPGSAAKLYHNEAECRRHEAKIEAMIASPPELPPARHNGIRYPQIAWPEAKLHDRSGRFIGFLMPEIDFGRSTSLVNLLQKSSRRIEKLSDYYGYRVLVARNLASVFTELHRAGHHMIDMKPANLRFYPSVSWMAVVDTDGFSIQGAHGRIPADVLSDEYIAPESWQKPPRELGEAQDLFALAVIIFQLLNNGLHPFAGAAGGSAQATDLQARILEGLYAYALMPRPGVAPSTASVHRMFRRGTRVLFDSAFQPRGQRPRAEE